MSPIDAATIAVLTVAVFLFVRPGSPINASTKEWLAARRLERSASQRWPELVRIAQPLYRTAGDPDVIIFADYECPFCRATFPAVDSAVERGVRVAIVQMPLKIHAHARAASLSALCASEAGSFIEADRWLMTDASWQADTSKLSSARVLGVTDSARFAACIANGGPASRLQRSVALADSIGVFGTPIVVSKIRLLREMPTADRIVRLAGTSGRSRQ